MLRSCQRDTPMEVTEVDHVEPMARFSMSIVDVATVGFTSDVVNHLDHIAHNTSKMHATAHEQKAAAANRKEHM